MKKNIILISLISILLLSCQKNEHWRYSQEKFEQGPVKGQTDLRNMLREYIVNKSCELLEQGAEKRIDAFKTGDWQTWRDSVRVRMLRQMGEMPYAKNGAPLNTRFVSRLELPHCNVENVLFESFKRWDVNASVFIPKKEVFPPPWKAIVVPVGHSSKTRNNYQIPAQVFASLGYAAVIFDPPGMAGEKQGGNDHFTDAPRGYLTGHSANRYFVLDAIRCIDYLATRDDIDLNKGVGMTGVSGGGTTTMYATLIDDRIKASGPACCALPAAFHPVLDAYAPCAESMAPGRFADGLDAVDLLCAAIPTPMLFMFGEKDEVFKSKWSHQIARDIQNAYEKSDLQNRFEFFADPGGHAYTVEMALRFTKWMDRWIAKIEERQLPKSSEINFDMIDPVKLFCYPNLDGNIFSLNKEIALNLQNLRNSNNLKEKIQKVTNIKKPIKTPTAKRSKPTQIWVHNLEEIILKTEPEIEIPATFMYPLDLSTKSGAILFFDDRGRWTELQRQNYLAEACDFLKRDQIVSSVLTVDLRGWGDTKTAELPYDVASWAHPDRWTSFVSAAMGDHILAMQIRDGLAALNYLRTRTEIDPTKIVIGGHGLGAIVALHVAAFDQNVAGLLFVDGLNSFESLAITLEYNWSVEAFLPHVLEHYDIPDLVALLKIPTMIVNVLDANKTPMQLDTVKNLYSDALKNNPKLEIVTDVNPKQKIIDFLKTHILVKI